MRWYASILSALSIACAAGTATLSWGPRAWAHGQAGNREFPPTIATDDPFVVDELAFPTLSYARTAAGDGRPSMFAIALGIELDKEIVPHFGLGVSETFIVQKAHGEPAVHGLDNLSLTARYQLAVDAPHEMVAAIALELDIGGTGCACVGAEGVTTFTPLFHFGKGFGDVPFAPIRPFALTGTLGQTIPAGNDGEHLFLWELALEYSLPYLQESVRDLGLPPPLRDMIPLVELVLATPETGADAGVTTGTISPGLLWDPSYVQLGVEVDIPVNRPDARVGVTVQLWIFLDDIFPSVFGHPLFEAAR